jgi:hypothetical protein
MRCVNCGQEVSELDGTRRDCARFDMHLDNAGDRRDDGVLCRTCYCAGGICWHCELDARPVGDHVTEDPADDSASWGRAEYRPDGEEDGGAGYA